ncbi:MAG: DUF882 domain-containing protein [Xanthobacteraceae bacterium]|nr:DUF882 domain-containing protein [Xanthobacteraceae bacterium]
MSSVLAARRVSLATLLLVAGAAFGLQQALAAPGDTRTITLHHIHTKEDVTITFKRNGQFDEEALKKINWALRDWRKDEPTKIDPHVIDLLWEVARDVGAKEPIHVIGGFRAPSTNEMLRRRSKQSGVAKHSLHTQGRAIDFFIPGVPLDVLRAAAMKAQGGGVGYYPTSGSPFVHLDVGNVRAWPRMTREQLVKLFPDGRTVHLPPDGNPLPGYQLALADIERGHRTAATPQKKSFLASLFNRDKDTEEVDDNTTIRETAAAWRNNAKKPAPAAAPARTVVAAAQTPAPAAAQAPATQQASAQPAATDVPLPPRRPIYQVAAAESRPAPAPAPRPAAPINLASLSPNEIINMRGLWDGFQEQASSESLNMSSSARRALASSLTAAGRDVTAAVGRSGAADRVPTEGALAYAAPTDPVASRAPAVPAIVTNKDSSSIAQKPVDNLSRNRVARTDEKFEDPWMRGLMLTASVQNSLVVTQVGEGDVKTLAQHMQKPATALVMTFSADPLMGTTTETFSGSAIVFPPTMTFNNASRRTAALR